MKEMKTLTIGGETFEVVDEKARTGLGDVYKKVVSEDYPVFNAILALFQKAIFKEDVTELIAKLGTYMKRDVVQLDNALIIDGATVAREGNSLIIS